MCCCKLYSQCNLNRLLWIRAASKWCNVDGKVIFRLFDIWSESTFEMITPASAQLCSGKDMHCTVSPPPPPLPH